MAALLFGIRVLGATCSSRTHSHSHSLSSDPSSSPCLSPPSWRMSFVGRSPRQRQSAHSKTPLSRPPAGSMRFCIAACSSCRRAFISLIVASTCSSLPTISRAAWPWNEPQLSCRAVVISSPTSSDAQAERAGGANQVKQPDVLLGIEAVAGRATARMWQQPLRLIEANGPGLHAGLRCQIAYVHVHTPILRHSTNWKVKGPGYSLLEVARADAVAQRFPRYVSS